MSSDNERVPLEACTLPGTIKVTRPALELAEKFQASIPAGWIVVFDWYDWGRTRASKDAPWIETGPGLDLSAFRIDQIPAQAIYRAEALRYAVLIPKKVVDSHPEKLIDLDGPRSVVLR